MTKKKEDEFYDGSVGHTYGQEWSAEKLEIVKQFAKEIDRKRTPEQRKMNEEMREKCRRLGKKDNKS